MKNKKHNAVYRLMLFKLKRKYKSRIKNQEKGVQLSMLHETLCNKTSNGYAVWGSVALSGFSQNRKRNDETFAIKLGQQYATILYSEVSLNSTLAQWRVELVCRCRCRTESFIRQPENVAVSSVALLLYD